MAGGSDVCVAIYSNIFDISERARVHHYADLDNIDLAVMDLSDSETCNLVSHGSDSTLADLNHIYIDLEDQTSEDLDHICTDLEDQDSHHPALTHTLQHMDRISTDSENHIQPHPNSHQTSAHLHRRCIDLENRTSEDADNIGTIAVLSQCRYSDQLSNGAAFRVPSLAEDSDQTDAISALSECRPVQPSVFHHPAEHSRSIHNAPRSAVQWIPTRVAAAERADRNVLNEKPKMWMASLSRPQNEIILIS
jgi:hypothetical protein